MVPKLREAFQKLESLTEKDQEALADRILEILEQDERAWDELFARPDVLAALGRIADDAIAADRRGETLPLEDIL